VSGSVDTSARIWDAVQHTQIAELRGHKGAVVGVSFNPDGTRIASASTDKTVRTWDAIAKQPIEPPLRGHGDMVLSVAFSPDGTKITSGSADRNSPTVGSRHRSPDRGATERSRRSCT